MAQNNLTNTEGGIKTDFTDQLGLPDPGKTEVAKVPEQVVALETSNPVEPVQEPKSVGELTHPIAETTISDTSTLPKTPELTSISENATTPLNEAPQIEHSTFSTIARWIEDGKGAAAVDLDSQIRQERAENK